MKKMLIVDGNSILNRAYYGIRPLTTKDGLYTHAVYGITNILIRQLDNLKPDYAVIAFDLPEPTFRHIKYDQYKANRHGMPPELAVQLPYAKAICNALGFKVVEKSGYEADDIIGTLAEEAKAIGSSDDEADTLSELLDRANDSLEVYILTGDRDSLQLIDDRVTVLLATNSENIPFNRSKFNEIYGIQPEQFVSVKALMGDSSDNIPGVAGVGEKTALKLIRDFGSLDGVYNYIDSLILPDGASTPGKSITAKLISGRENAYMSYELAEIERHAELGITVADTEYNGFSSELHTLLTKLEFTALIKKLNLAHSAEAETDSETTVDNTSDSSSTEFKEVSTNYAFDETVAFAIASHYVYISDCGGNYRCSFQSLIELKNFLINLSEKRHVIVYDLKAVLNFLCSENDESANLFSPIEVPVKRLHGQLLPNAFDISLAAYVLNPSDGEFSLDQLTTRFLGRQFDPIVPSSEAENNKKAIPFYGSKPLLELYSPLVDQLKANDQEKLYYNIELPTARVLSEMELTGFKVDVNGLKEFSSKLSVLTNLYAADIYELAGIDFNINSPKQLGEILFEKLKLPVLKKTKTGYTTNAETLEKLRPYHPIIDLILEYRQVTKLNSTYAFGLANVAEPDGRIHSSFNQTVTATGRLSSTEPNLQNIPIRQPLGRELRKFFIPRTENRVLIDADYSQIELRLLAHIAADETMTEAFKNGIDIHTVTASQVFRTPISEVTEEQRKRAKAVNFGIVYGIGEFSLAQDIKVSRSEAGEYIKSYFEKYPKVKQYMNNIIEQAKSNGYVSTMFGRRRYIPELSSSKAALRSFGERVAMNSPIQGSAADIIKTAMINVSKALKNADIDAQLILQVHDELVIEADKSCAEYAAEILRREMENAVQLSVPLTVDISIGKTWFDS